MKTASTQKEQVPKHKDQLIFSFSCACVCLIPCENETRHDKDIYCVWHCLAN